MLLTPTQKRLMDIATYLCDEYKILDMKNNSVDICTLAESIEKAEKKVLKETSKPTKSTTFNKTIELRDFIIEKGIDPLRVCEKADLSPKQRNIFMEVVNGNDDLDRHINFLNIKPVSVIAHFRRINFNISIILRDIYQIDENLLRGFM